MKALINIARTEGFSLESDTTIEAAMAQMLDNKNGCVVLLEAQKPVGIVTEGLVLACLEEGLDFAAPARTIARSPVITAGVNRPVEAAFDIVVSHNIRRLVLVDGEGVYKGIVLQEDLIDFLEEDVYKVDLKVADLLDANAKIVTMHPLQSMQDALVLMRREHIGSVVVAENERATGIVTEKDILSAGYSHADLSEAVQVRMSRPVLRVDAEAPVTEVIDLMRTHHVRRVVVCKKGRLHGVLTDRDVFSRVKGNVARMLQIKLRHAKEIMDLLPEAIIEIFDMPQQQTIHWMNRVAAELFGRDLQEHSPQELLGEAWAQMHAKVVKNGHLEHFTAKVKGRDFEFSGTISTNINSRYIKLIARDVTAHEHMKEQLRKEVKEEVRLRREQEYLMMHQSRLAATGEMIGHIAHQWRQPLSQLGGIFMNLESAQAFGDLDEVYLRERLQQGNALIKYMSQTIDDFRRFFSPYQPETLFDPVAALRQAVNIVSAALTYRHIDVMIDGAVENNLRCIGVEGTFAQAMLNLLGNASDALAGKKGKRQISIHFTTCEDMLEIRFCDNAGGIDPAILPDIFTPYTTTKQEGTGIGLYMTRLIIEQKMKGRIEVKNSSAGACFMIYVPLVRV